ncbi:hypothetical protein EMGBS5_07710 [Clavibacter sp.]|nr:hypothetical protein EMGBS5_07710 [Clavibacter sp.]
MARRPIESWAAFTSLTATAYAAAADSASFLAIANSLLAASYLALAALATAVNCFKVKFALLNLAAAHLLISFSQLQLSLLLQFEQELA